MMYGFITIYPINPQAFSEYRRSMRVSGAKDDPTDAALLLDYLEKHRDRLRALVLCDTRAICDAPDVAQGRRDMADKVVTEGPAVLVDGMVPKLFGAMTVANRPQMVEQTRGVMMAYPLFLVSQSLPPLMMQSICSSIFLPFEFFGLSCMDL